MRAWQNLPFVLACAACAASGPASAPPSVAPEPPPVASPVAVATPAAPSSAPLAPLPPPCPSPSPAGTATANANAIPAPTATPTATPTHDDDDTDDGVEITPPPTAANATSPLDAVSDAELEAKLSADPAALGTVSLGSIHSGALLFGAQMPAGANWQVVTPAQSFGAHETVLALAAAIDSVAAEFPGTPKAFIGDVSRQGGGHFAPHVSHQSGRDVDMSYYLTGDAHRWYVTANAHNLDLPRSWALVRAFITETDVELVLMDRTVQRLMKDFARSIGEDPAWLDDIFQIDGKSTRPIIIHVPGHASHLHVRFYAAESRELGRRAYPLLMKRHLIKPPSYSVDHVVRAGETIGSIAARERVSAAAIRHANHLGSNVVMRGRTIKIPHAGGIERPPAKVVAPPRRLPPPKAVATEAGNPCSGGSGGSGSTY